MKSTYASEIDCFITDLGFISVTLIFLCIYTMLRVCYDLHVREINKCKAFTVHCGKAKLPMTNWLPVN